MSDIVDRLNENIIADAFESRAIVDGALCERLIRERKEAADEIEKLRAALKPFAEYEYDDMDDDKDEIASPFILFKHIRAAAAALKETGNE